MDKHIRPVPGGFTAPRGFLAAGVEVGIKRRKKDVALLFSQVPAAAAAVFTQNRVQAAPLLVCREHLRGAAAQAVVVNSGCANACTGEQGLADARQMAALAARSLGLAPEAVLVASTGTIGVPLPMDKVAHGIGLAAGALATDGSSDAAAAIMTTDTFAKEWAVSAELQGIEVRAGGIAKGSGMIHPNMATMLAFVSTDLAVEPAVLQAALQWAADRSFNMVTVDGDTSTNDMAVVLANGLAGNDPIGKDEPGYALLCDMLLAVCVHLAKEIARDGEGATKLIEAHVLGAPSDADARLAARAIVASPLVKTAIFGEDANWGRILAAAGYSGAVFDPALVDVFLGAVQVCAGGMGLAFAEDAAARELAQKTVSIYVDMRQGEGRATAWGCDLTHGYVDINGSYRT